MLFLLFLLLRAAIKMRNNYSKTKHQKIEAEIAAENKAEVAAIVQRNIEYQKNIEDLATKSCFNRISKIAGSDFTIPAKNTLPQIEIDSLVYIYLCNIEI